MAKAVPLFALLALSLAIVLIYGGPCLAGPSCDKQDSDPAGYGNVPTCEPEQPPGPVKDMGSLPGPSTWGQAAVGILLPGLIGLGIALLLNQSGARGSVVTPSPAPVTPPQTGGAVAGRPASAGSFPSRPLSTSATGFTARSIAG